MSSDRFPTPTPSPRGERRIIYVSDPSSIAMRHLPDPVTEDDLQRWADDLADAGTDTFIQEAYTQGWTTYWRTDRYEYDARPQHKRFLPLLDAGVQPLQVLLDQSHKRGMEFCAGIRVNDNHGHISIGQGVGAGATFVTANPQWRIEPSAGTLDLGAFLDFSYAEVRDYVTSVVEHLLATFDVDGIELCFRDQSYFPDGSQRERQSLMTEFVRAVGAVVGRASQARARRLILGARVYPSLDLCRSQGLDVAAWIREGLVDYLSPGDVMYMATNERLDEFGTLTAGTDCMLYPPIMPHSSARRIRFLDSQPLNLEQKRAAAQNFYAAGADGLSFYNHQFAIDWAPFYPAALYEMRELADPEKVARGTRHYLFEPMLAGQGIWEAGLPRNGRPNPEGITLSRSKPGASGRFRFRVCEDLAAVRCASLLFRAYNMTAGDRVEVRVNGEPLAPSALKFRGPVQPMSVTAVNIADHEKRIDMKAAADRSSHATAGLSPIPAVPESYMTGRFRLSAPLGVFGDNCLEVTLVTSDPAASDDIVLDEVEVYVFP